METGSLRVDANVPLSLSQGGPNETLKSINTATACPRGRGGRQSRSLGSAIALLVKVQPSVIPPARSPGLEAVVGNFNGVSAPIIRRDKKIFSV